MEDDKIIPIRVDSQAYVIDAPKTTTQLQVQTKYKRSFGKKFKLRPSRHDISEKGDDEINKAENSASVYEDEEDNKSRFMTIMALSHINKKQE